MLALKHIHVTCALISISGFFLRGLLLWMSPVVLKRKWIKIAPHLVDTVLFVTGIWQAILLQRINADLTWLWPKLIALLLYIIFGLVVFRFARTVSGQVTFWLLALLCAVYILVTAYTRNPTWFFPAS